MHSRSLLSRLKTINFLGELAAMNEETGKSIYLPAASPSAEVGKTMENLVQPDILTEAIECVVNSKTGASLFWGPETRCLVIPPFPIREHAVLKGYEVTPLLRLLQRDLRIALVLIRLGYYAIGLYHGESPVKSKTGTGLVHGRHKKGGSSQKRFQRHRDKQIEYFLTRVCGHAREQLEPEARTIDYMVYGGARTTIRLLQKRCAFLQQFDDRILSPLLTIPEPHRDTLEAAIKSVWSSVVIHWQDDQACGAG